MDALEPFCSAFLYTHIDHEGTMQGFPLEVARRLREVTERQLIVAGGIRDQEEIDALDAMGVDAVAGMAIYLGRLAYNAKPRLYLFASRQHRRSRRAGRRHPPVRRCRDVVAGRPTTEIEPQKSAANTTGFPVACGISIGRTVECGDSGDRLARPNAPGLRQVAAPMRELKFGWYS